MVERSGLNARTFSRRFKAATGFAPLEYVQALRIEEAKQMLETDTLSVDEIGASVGYDDSASFRRVFKRGVALSPSAYRKKRSEEHTSEFQSLMLTSNAVFCLQK